MVANLLVKSTASATVSYFMYLPPYPDCLSTLKATLRNPELVGEANPVSHGKLRRLCIILHKQMRSPRTLPRTRDLSCCRKGNVAEPFYKLHYQFVNAFSALESREKRGRISVLHIHDAVEFSLWIMEGKCWGVRVAKDRFRQKSIPNAFLEPHGQSYHRH